MQWSGMQWSGMQGGLAYYNRGIYRSSGVVLPVPLLYLLGDKAERESIG